MLGTWNSTHLIISVKAPTRKENIRQIPASRIPTAFTQNGETLITAVHPSRVIIWPGVPSSNQRHLHTPHEGVWRGVASTTMQRHVTTRSTSPSQDPRQKFGFGGGLGSRDGVVRLASKRTPTHQAQDTKGTPSTAPSQWHNWLMRTMRPSQP